MARQAKGFLDAVFEAVLGFLWQSKPPPSSGSTSFRSSEPFRFASQDDGKEPAVTVEAWQPSPEWRQPVVRDLTPEVPSKDLLAELRDEAVHIAREALARRRQGGIVTAFELDFVQGAVEKLTRDHREVPLVLVALIES